MVKVSSIDFDVFSWKVEILKTKEEDATSPEDSIAHVVDTILALLIEKEVPHNLLISNEGKTIYVIPRKFHQSELTINTCWNDICGLPSFKEEDKYTTFKETEYLEILHNNVSVAKEDFQQLTKEIIEKFASVYILE